MHKILIIEGDEDIAYALKDALSVEGYDAILGSGLQDVTQTAPDVVLLDGQALDAEEGRAIERESRRQPFRLVFMDFDGFGGERSPTLPTLRKPFSHAQLIHAVEQVLRAPVGAPQSAPSA